MKNWIKSYGCICTSLIALTLSVIALCRCEPFEFTDSWLVWSIGISTSILGIAITAAIAIQVYNSVVFESRIRQIIDEKVADNKKHMDISIEETRQEFLSLLYIVQSQQFLLDKQYESTLDLLMRALVHAKECSYKIAYNTAIQGLEHLILIIKNNNIDFSLEKHKHIWYKDEIGKINDKQIIKIEKFMEEVQTRYPEIPEEVQELLKPFVKKDNE